MNYRQSFFIQQQGLIAHLINDTQYRKAIITTCALHQQAFSSELECVTHVHAMNQRLAFMSCRQGRGALKRSIRERRCSPLGFHGYFVTHHVDGQRCRRVSTGEVQLRDKWLFRRYRWATGSPPTCCLILTKQPVRSSVVPGLYPVFREGMRTIAQSGKQGHTLTWHTDFTSCQGRCSYEIRNEVWHKIFPHDSDNASEAH